jgi:hypothetical protein|tara:strand:- start:1934 stop:2056 length:123 start_codon:yes stop_codon:yes gene_type:complete
MLQTNVSHIICHALQLATQIKHPHFDISGADLKTWWRLVG